MPNNLGEQICEWHEQAVYCAFNLVRSAKGQCAYVADRDRLRLVSTESPIRTGPSTCA